MLRPVTNSLGGVVNQDISKMLLKPDMVVDSENFRLVTDDGGTTSSRVNIKGQEYILSIPDIPRTTKFSISSHTLTSFGFYDITINVDGLDYVANVLYSTSIEDIFVQLSAFLTAQGITNTLATLGNLSYITIENSVVAITTVTLVPLIGSPTDYTSRVTWSFEVKEGEAGLHIIGWTVLRDNIYLLTTNCTDDPNVTTIVSNGQWWKFSYDKSGDMTDPNNYSLTLIYNNALNLTTKRPVANPGMIEVRYENTDIQKIYWTDNFNRPRVINVADPSVQLKTPEELNLISAIDFDIPILQSIGNGTLLTGMYQFAYRLKRSNGAESKFSLPSAPIFLNNQPEATTDFKDYQITKSEEDSGKSITLSISNLDVDFDKIELVAIYYKAEGALPVCSLFYEGYIGNQSTITVTYSGSETLVDITVDEITAFAPDIRRAKSLASKYNTLFLSNVLLSEQDIDWDARAYRFPFGSTQTIIKDLAGNSYTVDSTLNYNILNPDSTQQPVPDNHDAIQSYADQANTYDSNLLYVPNASNYIFDLGGSGKNISYRFTTIDIIQDEKYNAAYAQAPYREVTTKTASTVYLGDHTYNTGTYFRSNISPYIMPLLAGYQRDEMYRFAIVFFDSQGNESFAKWIGDIRMPNVYMPNGSAKEDKDLSFPLISYVPSSHIAKSKNLVIEFSVDTSTLPSEIKGYSIVVVPRTASDKRIKAQGILSPTYKSNIPTNDIDERSIWTCSAGSSADSTGPATTFYGTNSPNGNPSEIWPNVMTLKSPELQFGGYFDYQSGDTFEITTLMDRVGNPAACYNTAFNDYITGSQADTTNISAYSFKNYTHRTGAGIPASILDATSDGPEYNIIDTKKLPKFSNNSADSITWDTLTNNWGSWFPGLASSPYIINASPAYTGSGGWEDYDRVSYSDDRLAIIYAPSTSAIYYDFETVGVGNKNFADIDGWFDAGYSRTYVANYKRNVTNQYGGNGYAQRANNVYRYANNYTRIVSGGSPIFNTIVACGDTYTLVHDMVYEFPDMWRYSTNSGLPFELSTSATPFENQWSAWRIYHQPLEVTINTALRANAITGPHNVPNRDNITGNPVDLNGNITTGEEFNVGDQKLYSWLPNIKNFYAKPFDVTVSREFDCRTYKSEPKTNNETVDSWATFRPSAYLDVESKYGPITNLIVFKDKLLFFQERGFGGFQVADKQALQADDNTQLYIGISGILDRYEYASTSIGSKHQFSFAKSDQSLIWFDTLSRKVYRLRDTVDPISDLKGLSAFFFNNTNSDLQVNDNPYEDIGVHATYDTRHSEFLISLLNSTSDKYYTVAYSELFDGFCGRYTYTPKVFINDKLNMFEVPSGSNLPGALFASNYGKYGVFYDHVSNPARPQDSKVSFIVNQEPTLEKVLTNMEVLTEAYTPTVDYKLLNQYAVPQPNDFFNKIRIFNSYQNTDVLPLAGISKRRKTIWNVKVPGNRVLYTGGNFDIFDPVNIATNRTAITERLKDRYFIAELYYDNKRNNKFVASSVNSLVMLNPR